MAKYINYTRNQSRTDGKRSNSLLKWLQAADRGILRLTHTGSTDRGPWKTTSFSDGSWVPCPNLRLIGLIDYFLVDLADGVVQWPEGEGARVLTRAVRHAVKHGDTDVRLSQVNDYIRTHFLSFPPLELMVAQMMGGSHPDVGAKERFQVVKRN